MVISSFLGFSAGYKFSVENLWKFELLYKESTFSHWSLPSLYPLGEEFVPSRRSEEQKVAYQANNLGACGKYVPENTTEEEFSFSECQNWDGHRKMKVESSVKYGVQVKFHPTSVPFLDLYIKQLKDEEAINLHYTIFIK